jgi:dihydrofolate synthase/folylpolyglutamate synthase
MLSILNPHFDVMILTRYTRNPRALPLDQLQSIATRTLTCATKSAANPTEAWNVARSEVSEDGLICVAGSMFLASEMQRLLTGAPQ